MIYGETLVEQLSKDAPFSWFLYDCAKSNPRYDFADYQHQASQVEAQLDALGLALQAGEPIADWLDPDDWGTVFVLAILGIRHQQPALFDQALASLDPEEETHPRELVDACLWEPVDDLTPWLRKLHEDDSSVAHQSMIRATLHRPDTFIDDILQHYLADPVPQVRIALLKWLGEHPNVDRLTTIQAYYADEQPDVAFAAICAGQRLGDTNTTAALERFALHDNPLLIPALTHIFLNAESTARRKFWLQQALDSDVSARIHIATIGVAGIPQAIEQLWDAMADAALCRAAGGAFSLMTGVDLEDEDLEADQVPELPEANQAAEDQPNDDDDDDAEDVADHHEWEDDLPIPNLAAIQAWWQAHQGQFAEDTAYLAGLPINQNNLRQILMTGNQRQRQFAALYLTLQHDQPCLDCGWPPWLQIQRMAVEQE